MKEKPNYHAISKAYVEDLLGVITTQTTTASKKEELHKILTRAFLSLNENDHPFSIRPYMHNAVHQLHGNYVRRMAANSKSYDDFVKEITTFYKHLKGADDLVSAKYVKDYLIRSTFEGHNVNEFTEAFIRHSYLGTFLGIRRLLQQMTLFLESGKKPQGRPSLSAFYEYVYELTRMYMGLTRKPFSILRHAGHKPDGTVSYDPITPAHTFVFIATKLMANEAARAGITLEYTDKNIYNACEKAQQKHKNVKTPINS